MFPDRSDDRVVHCSREPIARGRLVYSDAILLSVHPKMAFSCATVAPDSPRVLHRSCAAHARLGDARLAAGFGEGIAERLLGHGLTVDAGDEGKIAARPAANASASTGKIGNVTSVSLFSVLIVRRHRGRADGRSGRRHHGASQCRATRRAIRVAASRSASAPRRLQHRARSRRQSLGWNVGSVTPAVGSTFTNRASTAHANRPRIVSRKCRA